MDADNKQANINSVSGNRNTRKQMVDNQPAMDTRERVIRQIKPLDMKNIKDLGIESNILSALTKFTVKSAHELPSTSNNSSKIVSPSIPAMLSNVKTPFKSSPKKIETTIVPSSPCKKVNIVSNIVIRSSTKSIHEATKIISHTAVSQAIETESNGETNLATEEHKVSTRSSPLLCPMSSVTHPNHKEDAEAIEDSFDGFTDKDLSQAISRLNESKCSLILPRQTPNHKRKFDEQKKCDRKRRKTKNDTPVQTTDVHVYQNLSISEAFPLQLSEEGSL